LSFLTSEEQISEPISISSEPILKNALKGSLEINEPYPVYEEFIPEPNIYISSSVDSDLIFPTREFIEGFFNSFDFFNEVAKKETCLSNEKFRIFIKQLLNKLVNIKIDESLIIKLEGLLKEFKDNKDLIMNEIKQCKVIQSNIEEVFRKLAQNVFSENYVNKVVFHALTDMKRIEQDFQMIKNFAHLQEYKNLGKTFGQLVKFLFFWDVEKIYKNKYEVN